MLLGWSQTASTKSSLEVAGNACKAALLSTLFNLRKGLLLLESKGVQLTELGLSGGLIQTPECGQIVADVLGLPVRLLPGAEEGCAWGAAVLANFTRILQRQGDKCDWHDYLDRIETAASRTFTPSPEQQEVYEESYSKYLQLLELQPQLQRVVHGR